jgi:hypothetical protein
MLPECARPLSTAAHHPAVGDEPSCRDARLARPVAGSGELGARGLLDRDKERPADLIEGQALGFHREDFESHRAQLLLPVGLAADELAARLRELVLKVGVRPMGAEPFEFAPKDAGPALRLARASERVQELDLEYEDLVPFGQRGDRPKDVTEVQERGMV